MVYTFSKKDAFTLEIFKILMRREREDTRILMRDMFTKERSQKVYHTEKEQSLTKMEILTKER